MEAARLETVFGADTRELQAAYAKEQQLQGKSIQGTKNMAMQLAGGGGLLIASAAAARGLFQLAQEASSLEETQSFTNVTFGEGAVALDKWGDSALKNMGMAKQTALDAANGFGGLFKTTGSTTEEAVGLSEAMVQLAGDMASAKDVPLEEALLSLKSGLIGEAEPMRRFNVLLSEAEVKSFAYANGIAKQGEELTEAQKVQARYGVILAQTTDMQGDFARTSDSMANRQRAATEAARNAAAVFGKDLSTALSDVYGIGSKVLGWLEKLPPNWRNTILLVGGLTTVVGPAAQGLFFMTQAWQTLTARQAAGAVAAGAATTAVAAETGAVVANTAAVNANNTAASRGLLGGLAKAAGVAAGVGLVAVAVDQLGNKLDEAGVEGLAKLFDVDLQDPTNIDSWKKTADAFQQVDVFGQLAARSQDQATEAAKKGQAAAKGSSDAISEAAAVSAAATENAALAMAAAQETIRADARETKGAFMDWRAGVREAAFGSADALADMAGDADTSFKKLRSNLNNQMDDVTEYDDNWTAFLAKNPPAKFVKQLGDMGIEGAGILAQLTGASNKNRKEWISDFLSIDKTTDRTTGNIVGYVGRLSGAISTADSRVKDLLASLGGLENIAINIHADVAIQKQLLGPASSSSSSGGSSSGGSSSPSPRVGGQFYGGTTQVFVDGERAQVRTRNREVLLSR